MKIALLAPANSIHTQRWASSLLAAGHEVSLLSQHVGFTWHAPSGLDQIKLPFTGERGYLLNSFALRRHLQHLRPDLLNAHYASGYGTLAALSGFRPTLTSVWGSDVFDFPYESAFKGHLLRWNLRRASAIASTSNVMARQVACLVPDLKPAYVTPFGVDCQCFTPSDTTNPHLLTIGIVKTLVHKYGIDVLIRAFSLLLGEPRVAELDRNQRLRLVIAGTGGERETLEALVAELKLVDRVEFVGQIAHEKVPRRLQKFDIFCAPSRLDSESFGVAAVEASACGLPVVVSDAGGLPEVVLHGVTGLVVPRNNPEALAQALQTLVLDPAKRKTMGQAGRAHVLEHYEWGHCVETMVAVYRDVIERARRT